MNKKSTSKAKKFKTVKTNITLLPSGMYCARKRMNGTRLSKNFRTIKACATWLKSL